MAFRNQLFEIWSPNSAQTPFYPGVQDFTVRLATALPESQRRCDGHMGRFDPTISPQHYNPQYPWLPFIRCLSDGSHPEHRAFLAVWKPISRPNRGMIHLPYLQQLAWPTWPAKSTTKPTKRINMPCTEMGATPYFGTRSTFSTSKSTSSMTSLTLIRVQPLIIISRKSGSTSEASTRSGIIKSPTLLTPTPAQARWIQAMLGLLSLLHRVLRMSTQPLMLALLFLLLGSRDRFSQIAIFLLSLGSRGPSNEIYPGPAL